MQIFRSLEDFRESCPSVVTIGNFDGVHCGHRMVIDSVIQRAHHLGARSVAVTFDPHPLRVLKPGLDVRLITPLNRKLELLSETGLDSTLVIPFTPEFSHWTARKFAERVLVSTLHVAEVHEGETFRFGHDAEEDVEGLAAFGDQMGFSVHAYQPLIARGGPISSSRIRSLIAAGNVSAARPLLGRPFSIVSKPASGRGYGTLYTVPTINLAPYTDLVPADGVYITTLKIGAGASARLFRGVTNAGNRPTFGADSFAIETHLFNFEPLTLTESTPLELTFLRRLRDEQRFDSPESLRAQISRDIAQANRYFALADALKADALKIS